MAVSAKAQGLGVYAADPGREARWRGSGGLVTCPDAQIELGLVQVHHIVPQEPVQHVHDHRLEHHFSQPFLLRAPALPCPSDETTRFTGSWAAPTAGPDAQPRREPC